ncbi:MAG: sugar-binding transcriptional regulator [Clostridium sp.]|nr:sugar-binding transcriptional regulator [Clostridium sp.]
MKDKRTLIKIAHYYYNIGLTQEEIGKKLSMSRQKVNRIINSLIENGIVTIQINGYEESYVKLEQDLEKEFSLQEVIVTSKENDEDLMDKLSKVAASYLERTIDSNDIIGVSWGRTLSKTAANLGNIKRNNISVVQIVGGTNIKDPSIKADEITRAMASKLNGIPYIMYAPAIVKDEQFKEAMMSEQSIKNIFNLIKKCTMAIVGIGNLSEKSTIYMQNYLSKEELKRLEEDKCVGDICLQAYNINGEIIKNSISSRVIGIGVEDLKRIPKVIGIAGGKEKAEAILGALRGNFIDVLITDNETAEYILKIMNR